MASWKLYLLTVLAVCNSALGLKCYSCDSSKGINCNFGLLSFSFPEIDCDAGDGGLLNTFSSILPKQCIKLVGVDKDNNEYIARGCSVSTGPINTCQAIAKTIQFADQKDLKTLDCYTCNEDKCNSAPGLAGMTGLGFLVACILFLF